MNTNSKLTPEQIAEGWIEITGVEQLRNLPKGHYDLLFSSNRADDVYSSFLLHVSWYLVYGERDHSHVANAFIAYRPLPSYEEYQSLKKKCESCTRTVAAWQHETLRDKIAMAVLNGFIANSFSCDGKENLGMDATPGHLASLAYDHADAMLEARKGGGE